MSTVTLPSRLITYPTLHYSFHATHYILKAIIFLTLLKNPYKICTKLLVLRAGHVYMMQSTLKKLFHLGHNTHFKS
jgi:hypothetical protein